MDKNHNYVIIHGSQCVKCKNYHDFDCKLEIVNQKSKDVECKNFILKEGLESYD